MNDDIDDDLDRALFALPLEEPPARLRASILNATVYAKARAAEPLARPWELALSGVMLAVGTWLLLAIFSSKSAAGLVAADTLALVRAFSDPMTLEWLAAGIVATLAFWFVGDMNLRLPTRGAGT